MSMGKYFITLFTVLVVASIGRPYAHSDEGGAQKCFEALNGFSSNYTKLGRNEASRFPNGLAGWLAINRTDVKINNKIGKLNSISYCYGMVDRASLDILIKSTYDVLPKNPQQILIKGLSVNSGRSVV